MKLRRLYIVHYCYRSYPKSRLMKTGKSILMLNLFVLLFSGLRSNAQDIHFSQFFETPLLRNPGLAGIFTGDYRVQGVYRDQWNSFTNAYRTGSFNAEYKLPVGRTDDY